MDEKQIAQKLQETVEWLRGEYASIRTGQAAPGLVEKVLVESYGARVPINQTATVSVEDARTLRISPWDASTIPAIETSLRESDLGLSVATDSSGLRAIFPELTAERRAQLSKLASQKHEDARIRVRGIRDDASKAIDKQEKAGEISQDDKFAEKESLQTQIDKVNADLETLYKQKVSELTA
jgi:ribosome recycling factor